MSDFVSPALVDKASKAVVRAEAYLRGRQCSAGGFSFYKSEYLEEPNLKDTHHAIAALRLIGAEIPRRDAIVDFLETQTMYGAGYLFDYAFARDLLGLGSELRPERVRQIGKLVTRAPDIKSGTDVGTWLEETLQTVLLQQRFTRLPRRQAIVNFVRGLKSGGGYGIEPNLLDTHLSVAILSALGDELGLTGTRDFVDELQTPYFGFVLTNKSRTATLETVHAGVRSCSILDVAVRYPTDVLAFVLSCQARDGGFSRAPIALPDIELTHEALEVIVAIAGERLFPAIAAWKNTVDARGDGNLTRAN